MSMMTCARYSSPTFRKSHHLPLNCTFASPPPPFISANRTRRLQPPPSTRLQLRRIKGFTGRFSFSGRKLMFSARAEVGQGDEVRRNDSDEARKEQELRGKSTMPDRFRHLTKEAPERPLRWPWFIALIFLVYAWRMVLWELSNWRKALMGIAQIMGYILKLILAIIFRFIGDPISFTIFYIETALYSIRSFYSSIVSSAPVPELTMIIMLASIVLAIAEVASPDSVNRQPFLLTASGIIGYAAVRGFISEPLFWTLLLGLFSFARFVKKRDYVASALPVASVLASVGEPWVRALAIMSFAGLAIHHQSEKSVEEQEVVKDATSTGAGKPPLALLGVALAIGIHAAAKWAGYRHLTWMIV